MVDSSSLRRLGRYARFSTDDPSGRYIILTFWIIIIIAIFPYFVNGNLGLFVLSLLLSFVLISAVFTITGRSKYSILALILIVPALIAAWTSFFIDSDLLREISSFLTLMVMFLVTFSIFLEVVRAKTPIPRHIIWGAISVYLLIGLSFATLYYMTYIITPSSFYYSVDPSLVFNFSDFVYFSFVTLATLGYGDIVPITDQARSFAILEAITGSLYLAVLIAKIVSLSLVSTIDKGK